ncbi:GTPase domain-containing protein [Methylomonas sp. DH-1]|uniref:GTPase domain-containing protein n=1 Tax=Methylomonas sp. (strain DH-1) TaxID=1727196 RepID=UPI0007C95FCE|nr:GTPase domain-containing protein [Methylomonas sp. DH-1]ANE55229.1 GTP-binding protein [Methylomonas sp. DH-1]
MLEFIQLLKQRYEIVLQQLDRKNSRFTEYQQRIEQLLHAEAFIRKGQLLQNQPALPLQIAVIGPTQAGKSSVVNLLLNSASAGVSPLAGYTVHAQGFCHRVPIEDCAGLQQYFGRFQQLQRDGLRPGRYDCYSLSPAAADSGLLPDCVLWDTPDFDSIDSADYREGVVRTIALADAVILVVSKEKYADQSVWDLMKFIEAYRQPTLVCVNKLSEGSEAVILDSLRDKWRQTRSDPPPPMVALLFQKAPAQPQWPVQASRLVAELAKKAQRSKHADKQQQLIGRYWLPWLEPVFSEHHAQRHWQTLVDQCLADALRDYRRDYLNHPHHYETFQNALLNLLTLLEIPGLARILGKTRRAMTWPFRKMMDWSNAKSAANPSHELAVLQQLGEHLLIQLADRVLEKTETEPADSYWWRENAMALRQRRGEILLAYQRAVDSYHQDFQQDVEAAAQRLYRKLQDQPLVLNSLRATRATTDAGAMLLAIQAGGIGVQDLVITPLILTITSLLAESAIGSYMHRVEAELKQHQFATVNNALFDGCLKQRLYQLPLAVHSQTRFNISEQQCHAAELALKEKKHGLRIL